MTLLAVTASPEAAHLLTDSWSYETSGRTLGRVGKVTMVPGFNAVVSSQGDGRWRLGLASLSATAEAQVDTFDDWLEFLPLLLSQAWGHIVTDLERYRSQHDGVGEDLVPSVALVAGYSSREGRFVARGFASDDGFEPFDVNGIHVQPSPTSYRPSVLELRRIEAAWARNPSPNDARQLEAWQQQPPAPVPTTDEEWLALAARCRAERTMLPVSTGVKVLMGGDIHLTTVTQAGVEQRRIGAFDDSNEVVARIMVGTDHPLGQLGPCVCGSGERFIDCCLVLEDPCPCGSGSPLAVCCSITASAHHQKVSVA